jgi:hypothetical protein
MTTLTASEKQALLARLEAMQIEPAGAERTFVSRLRQENGWTASFAQRVLQEYRRFLFLAATAGHPVTPSDEVDQAWHLHLAYTRHYWEELCGCILPRPLHHGPTAGGTGEQLRYQDQYAATLESYRAAFGTAPPEDIWPPQRERFAARYERVDRRRNWVIPKVPWRVVLGGLFVAGCAVESDKTGGLGTVQVISIVLLLLAGAGIIYAFRQRAHRDGGQDSGTGCGGAGGGTSRFDDSGSDGGCSADGGGGGGCGGGCGGCGS